MNSWNYIELLSKVDYRNKEGMHLTLRWIQTLFITHNIDLPQPIIEKDIDGFNISWFKRKNNSALYFSLLDKLKDNGHNEYSINLLKDCKAEEIINPSTDNIIKLTNKFLGKE